MFNDEYIINNLDYNYIKTNNNNNNNFITNIINYILSKCYI
jgi:hypothetical protein